ncbi:MAG: hypothetical protein ACYC92_10530, partial [Candidatus Acidiferrales bacterium]
VHAGRAAHDGWGHCVVEQLIPPRRLTDLPDAVAGMPCEDSMSTLWQGCKSRGGVLWFEARGGRHSGARITHG